MSNDSKEMLANGDTPVEVREMTDEEAAQTGEILGGLKEQENPTTNMSNVIEVNQPSIKKLFKDELNDLVRPELQKDLFGGKKCIKLETQYDLELNVDYYIFHLEDGTFLEIRPAQLEDYKKNGFPLQTPEGYLTPEEMDQVTEALAEGKGEVDKRMQEIIDSTEVDTDAELESEEVQQVIGSDPLDFLHENEDGTINIDLDLLASEYPEVEAKPVDYGSERVKSSILEQATGTFGMTDEEAFEFYMLVKEYKANPKKQIHISDLPLNMRQECAKQVQDAGGSVTDYDMFAQLLVQTFCSEIEQNEVFIDIEKELDEALKIPSVMDMFFEHSNQMAHEHIPAMIEKCKEAGDEERAALLERIGKSIDDAFDMKSLIEYYKNTTRVRKACRRDVDKVKTYINAMNYNNEKTKFKMQDATGMLTALSKVFIEDPMQEVGEPLFYEDQIIKFVILVCCRCSEMDANSIVSATYMYYLMKNIISLTYVQEAKTDFARQLIDNISDVMSTIIGEEAEFYAANPKREGKQKRSKRNRR